MQGMRWNLEEQFWVELIELDCNINNVLDQRRMMVGLSGPLGSLARIDSIQYNQ